MSTLWKMTPSIGAGLLHSLRSKVKYHLLEQFVQLVMRMIPMYTTRRKVPDFSLVKSHAFSVRKKELPKISHSSSLQISETL